MISSASSAMTMTSAILLMSRPLLPLPALPYRIYEKPGAGAGHMDAGMIIAQPPGLNSPPCR